MSMFNPELFLETETTEAGSTRVAALHPGEYGPATIVDVKAREASGYPFLDVTVELTGSVIGPDGRTIKEQVGSDTRKLRGSFILDLNAAGQLDMAEGKNVKLNRLRKALGQNVPGQPWKPSMLLGRSCRVLVSNRPDKNDPDTIYDEVKSFLY